MVEGVTVSAEFKRLKDQEIDSSMIKSANDLRRYLEVNGVWSVTKPEADNKGVLRWDDPLLAKLYGEFVAGERKFYLSTLRNDLGEVKTRFETEIRTVLADVYYTTKSGARLKMEQYIDYYVATMDETSRRLTSENFLTGFTKKSDCSVSGKLNTIKDGNDWESTLHREMKEELRLRRSSYRLSSEGMVKHTEGFSRGYPGLWTRQDEKKYEVELIKGYRKQYVELGKPQRFGSGWKRPVNLHKWTNVTGV